MHVRLSYGLFHFAPNEKYSQDMRCVRDTRDIVPIPRIVFSFIITSNAIVCKRVLNVSSRSGASNPFAFCKIRSQIIIIDSLPQILSIFQSIDAKNAIIEMSTIYAVLGRERARRNDETTKTFVFIVEHLLSQTVRCKCTINAN